MQKQPITLAILTALCLAAALLPRAAQAQDSIRTTKGSVLGRIRTITPTEIEVDVTAGIPRKIPVNEIVLLTFEDEPIQLKTAKNHVLKGQYEAALAALEKVDVEQLTRADLKAEYEYYRALARAKLALGGAGEIAAAGREMAAFVAAQRTSYHWIEGNEVVGDLLVANGNYDRAEPYYAAVASAPWPEAKMRAGVAAGRALLAQGKTSDAQKQFESVLGTPETEAPAPAERAAATVGRARCLIAAKQTADAIAALQQVIERADPQQSDLLAQAYTALGVACRAAGQDKEALLAFLHVDLLYFNNAEAHAESLANLVALWRQMQRPEREAEARQRLQQRYANSVWARQAG